MQKGMWTRKGTCPGVLAGLWPCARKSCKFAGAKGTGGLVSILPPGYHSPGYSIQRAACRTRAANNTSNQQSTKYLAENAKHNAGCMGSWHTWLQLVLCSAIRSASRRQSNSYCKSAALQHLLLYSGWCCLPCWWLKLAGNSCNNGVCTVLAHKLASCHTHSAADYSGSTSPGYCTAWRGSTIYCLLLARVWTTKEY